MASYELIALNEATPQLRAPGAADTGVVSNLSVTTNAAVGGTLGVTGAATLSSTLGVTGAITNSAGTANGVTYLNGSKVLTSGSGLQFDGTNLGLGVPPSAWTSKAIQIGSGGSGISSVNGTEVVSNAYYDAGTWRHVLTAAASWYSAEQSGAHKWYTAPSGTAGNAITFTTVKTINASGHWLPGADNTQNLGSGALRMAVLYAGTGTINTSDATEKTAVVALGAAEIAAAKELALEIGSFQFLDSVERKGAEIARHHIGMTVQRAIEVMESHGLDPFGYAFICYDEWDAETKEVICDDGEFSREIQRQVVVETPVNYTEIEIINGAPTMVSKTRTDRQPQVEAVAVVDENGAPVVVDGKPLVHPVPVMETVTERYNIVTAREAGSRYGFRPDQLALFMIRGLVA